MKLEIDLDELAKNITDNVVRAITPIIQPAPENTIFDVDSLSEYLKVPPKWIYSHKHQLPHSKLDGHLRFSRFEIDKMIANLSVKGH